MEDIVVSDVLLITDQGRITVSNLPDKPGNCSQVFQAVATGGIVVDMIVQNLTSAGRAELSFSVPLSDLERAAPADARGGGGNRPANHGADRSQHRQAFRVWASACAPTPAWPGECSATLAERNINIGMINTSEVRVSVVVDRDRGEEALACLKAAFNVR